MSFTLALRFKKKKKKKIHSAPPLRDFKDIPYL